MIYSKEYETMLREEIEQLQIERLQATINRVYRNVAFYHRAFDRAKVAIDEIRSLADLQRLPFTSKSDLRDAYPYDMFAVPLRDILRIHSTAGATGKPVVVGYTRNDLAVWSSLCARVLAAAGITESDFVQIAFDYNLSAGGLGFHYGAEKIGASVIPASGEDIERQITVMRDYKTSALISTPSYAQHIAAILGEMKLHPEELSLRIGIFGSEPWSSNLRSQIEQGLRISAFDSYGTTEIMGHGVAFECEHHCGLHVSEDHFIVEVVDPDSGEPRGPGEDGELVLTTVTKQGFPLVRYRTGDITAYTSEPCECGRTLARMSRVSGRSDDMIIVEGVNVFPSEIEQILLEFDTIEPHYLIVLTRESGVDSVEIQLEIPLQLPFVDDYAKLENFRSSIAETLERRLGLSAKVTFVEHQTIARSTGGTMRRVDDRRQM